MPISKAQVQILNELVEATRIQKVRAPFMAFQTATSYNLIASDPEFPEDHEGFFPADLEELEDAGLLRIQRANGAWHLTVTNAGFEKHKSLASTTRPIEAVSQSMVDLLSSSLFKRRHPDAASKWAQAYSLLSSQKPGRETTAIGHHCREALQYFASSLLKARPSPSASADPTKTVNRIRAVLEAHGPKSSATQEHLEALLTLWGTTSDLAQRQEHGALREGEALDWEDARRLTLATVVVMHEVDRLILGHR